MENRTVRAGIVGVSGYSGCEVLTLLLAHPDVRVTYVSANNTEGKVSDIWPRLKGKTSLVCSRFDLAQAGEKCDVVFLAVPHTVACGVAPALLKAGVRVIDLSGDYRLQSTAEYKFWYGAPHKDKVNLKKAVYGLPELFRVAIRTAGLVSNPGCYPTAALLALAPVAGIYPEIIKNVIIDAKSGVSGAGKKLLAGMMFGEINENFKAYKVLRHQHTPEIRQFLCRIAGQSIPLTFVPHLLPLFRGIFETIYLQLDGSVSEKEILTLYHRFYKTEPFIRVLPSGSHPETKNVQGTNFCDIGIALSETKDMLVLTSAIDNLVKGAAGQAVQNMNIMFGFAEETALL